LNKKLKNTKVTISDVTKRFERLADKAEKKDQFAAAINAEYRSGQLAGAFM
jgi:hypothetical protein